MDKGLVLLLVLFVCSISIDFHMDIYLEGKTKGQEQLRLFMASGSSSIIYLGVMIFYRKKE